MATVYLGRDLDIQGSGRTVAIKRLRPQFAKDPEFVAMFLDEARLTERIRHPNVVPTFDVVTADGELFIVMEYVQGESLSRLSRAMQGQLERVPIPILLRVMRDALQGLHAAHEACDDHGASLEIVHRDVTPQNIFVGIDGLGRLLDFGVAKAAGRSQTTRDGQIKGKLAYMAPEQLRGGTVTRQTDVYAASVVLWELLAGQRLFAGGNEAAVIARLVKRDIQPPSAFVPEIPPELDEIVMRGLEADLEERYGTAEDLCVALAGSGVQAAAHAEVGAWVQEIAKAALDDRAARILATERRNGVSARDASRVRPASVLPPPRTGRARGIVVAGAIAACLVVAAIAFARGRASAPPAQQGAAASTSAAPAQ